MIDLAPHNLCTGCSTCEYVCPQNAVSMKENSEGFLFPEINEDLCISCKKCQSICPVLSKTQENLSSEYFVGRLLNDDIRAKSSSGGMFFALSSEILNAGGVVFASGFDENFRVVHKRAETYDDVYTLMGSKYVQSYMGPVFEQLGEAIKSNRPVLFVGTPCQVAGIRKLFGTPENLTLVDFICHGVPSPKLFEKYLHERCKEEIKSISFRDKSTHPTGMQFTITYNDRSKYTTPTQLDPYMLAFIQNISLRKSCGKCKLKGNNYQSDITLGDAWGIDNTQNPLCDKKGVSLTVSHTERGKNLVTTLRGSKRVQIEDYSFLEAKQGNAGLVSPVRLHPIRDRYYKDIDKLSVTELFKKYCSNSFPAKARRFLAKIRKDR